MTKPIQVGDRVRWWELFKFTKRAPQMMIGTVRSVGGPYVGIVDDKGHTWVRKPAELTVITDTAAQPLDEAQREQTISNPRVDEHDDLIATHPDPFKIICTDYELMLEYGDLGGVEML